MARSADGFLRPVQTAPLSATQDGAIAAICPGLGQSVDAGGRTEDILWGPFVEMAVGHATDGEMRFAASSGGALSALALWLVESGQVDAVVQNRADPDLPVGNLSALSADRAGVIESAGSRYAASAPLALLPELLKTGKRYAFVGKPCDIAALRALAGRDPEVDRAFPVMLSFFCAGVPSRQGAEAVLRELGTDLASTRSFRFRGNGWPGRASAVDRAGMERSMSYHDSWGKILSKHVQHRCKICADGTGVAADIVCADAWESDEDGYPLFEERDGVSLIVARNAKGQDLVHRAANDGVLQLSGFDPATLASIQPGQRERRRALLARLAGLKVCGRPIPKYTGLHIVAASRQNPFRRNLRNFLGMVRRTIRNANRPS
jgi:coenzyme F420 hydrogenase subunit beta